MTATEPTPERLQTSNRDDTELATSLGRWLAGRDDLGRDVRLERCERPEANGMSSDTLLFDASWEDPGGGRVTRNYVARLRPAADACPIFPTYDLERQVRVMRLVGERCSAPVPAVHWYESGVAALGAPFFVMDRVDGRVPPDVLPYPFDGSWVQEATPEERATMQRLTVDVLAAIHGVPVDGDTARYLSAGADGGGGAAQASPLRRHFDQEKEFYSWACDGLRFPVLERAFDWLEERWPAAADSAPAVVSWGDARIGNIVYDGFEPVGILDWEMASLAPRELDLGWFIFLHRFFDDITTGAGMAGLPDFLQRDQVEAQYSSRTGHEPRDLDWFLVYAALRHGTVMTRAMRRRVLFGEMDMPDDPEDLILHRATLEQMIGP
jgi:aminoglycoside phosphotransferase (APT) family kinase protein